MQPKSKSVEEIEVIILEQYLRMLSPELQVWVGEHDPQSASQAATLADVFVAARKGNQPWCWKPGRDDRRGKCQFVTCVVRRVIRNPCALKCQSRLLTFVMCPGVKLVHQLKLRDHCQ